MARLLAGILACAVVAAPAGARTPPNLPYPTDLRQEAIEMTRTSAPLVVLFSQKSCRWCDQARAHLVPMARESAGLAPALFRQINLDADTMLIDFSGRQTTQRAFARAEKVRFTPTVVIFDANGKRLGEPILGMRLPDFYGQYVEQAIEDARARIINPLERTHQ